MSNFIPIPKEQTTLLLKQGFETLEESLLIALDTIPSRCFTKEEIIELIAALSEASKEGMLEAIEKHY